MNQSNGSVRKGLKYLSLVLVLMLVALLVAAFNTVKDLEEKVGTVAGAVVGNPNAIVQLSIDIAEALAPDVVDGTASIAPCAVANAPTTDSTPPTDSTLDLDQAVAAQAATNREALVMEMASYLETTWNNQAVGGGAYGYWQIQHPGPGGVHSDITLAQAKTPSYAAWYMMNGISPNFRDGLKNVDPKLWVTNPELAAETAIYNTERPGTWYHDSQGQSRVNEAFTKSRAKLVGMGYSPDVGKDTSKGSNVIGPTVTATATDPATQTRDSQLAQHLFVGVSDASTAKVLIAKGIGGLFIEPDPSTGRVSPDLLKALPQLISSAKLPMLVATDQEYTSTVNSLGLADGKKASDLATMSDTEVPQRGTSYCKAMAAQGFNMDFAPVVDEQNSGNTVIGKYFRGISSDPQVTIRVATAFMDGLTAANVTPVIKHFPDDGGPTTTDPHTTLAKTANLQVLEKGGLLPFKSLSNKKTAIMVGNLIVPNLTKPDEPASESQAAYLYLRNEMQFNGLAITDELGGMAGAGSGPVADRVIAALNRGADMALVNSESIGDFDAFFKQLQSNVTHTDDSRIVGQKQAFGLKSIQDVALQQCKATTLAEAYQDLGGVVLTAERNTVLNTAFTQIGVPYSWSGGGLDGPSTGICDSNNGAPNDCNVVGFDCSRYVEFVYGKIGIDLGNVSYEQYRATMQYSVSLDKIQPGDLLFFRGAGGAQNPFGIGHVGIALGNGKFINAPQSGQLIQISDLSANRMKDFVAATDPFAAKAAHILTVIPTS